MRIWVTELLQREVVITRLNESGLRDCAHIDGSVELVRQCLPLIQDVHGDPV